MATKQRKSRSKPTPQDQHAKTMIRRRRAVMLEAGIEHQDAADAIQKRYKIPTTRQAVTNVINGHFTSGGGRIEAALVRLICDTLSERGERDRAATITPAYLGWEDVIAASSP